MGDVAEILKTVHEIFRDNSDVPIVTDSRNLGMAYAVAAGTETTAVVNYSPWADAEVDQYVSVDDVLGNTAVRISLIMSWRYSSGQQYIYDAYLSKRIDTLASFWSVSITVRFSQPSLYNNALESYEIPFEVDVLVNPTIGATTSYVYKGTLFADGTGTFRPV